MSITELSVKRPTILVAVFSLCIGLGLMGYLHLGADLFPSANTPFVGVLSTYPGAGSKEIETSLVKPIEDAVSGLAGIKTIKSSSGEGFGSVVIQFTMDTDGESALTDVQKAVDGVVGSLPKDATRPIVRKFDLGSRPILTLSLSGPFPYEQLRGKADDLQIAIENVSGVGQVSLVGAPKREVDISLDMDTIEAYGIGIQTIQSMLEANNMNVPAGILHETGIQRTVRVVGEFASLDEVRALLVPLPRGGSVRLGELARVEFGYPADSGRARMDQKLAIGLLVVKTSDANVVAVTRSITKTLDEQRKALPTGMKLEVASDETSFIQGSLDETMRDLLLGILTTAIVLVLFLREWRSSLIVLVAIPTSLISTFFMMYVLKFTLNVISTMALALCIGILVDDSIVVLENIHRHADLGEDPQTAAINGRREIGMAAIAITLCDVVVFAPVAFLSDLVGQFFRQFGLTVVCATLFSLFVSFTLTPALASRLHRKSLPIKVQHEGESEAETGAKASLFDRTFKAAYKKTIGWALAHRRLVIVAVAALFVLSLALIPLKVISSEFLPPFDQGKLMVDLSLDSGSSVEDTDKAVARVEAHLFSLPEVSQVFSQIGMDAGPNYAELTIELKDKHRRSKSESAIARELRAWGAKEGGLDFSVTEPSIVAQTSLEGKKPFILTVSGPDREVLASIADMIEARLKATKGAVDVENSMSSRKTEITLTIDRLAMSQYGIQASDVASALRTAVAGENAGVLRIAGDEHDIMLRLDPSRLKSPRDLGEIMIRSRGGALVPMNVLASIGRSEAANLLIRENRSNIAIIQANLQGRALGTVTADLKRSLAGISLPAGYSYSFKGDSQTMSDSFASLGWVLAGSIALVYLILLVLYNSFLTPAIRMLSLPAGIIGGFVALALTGKAINIVSFIGIIMLDGLASKNGTLLIDYTNTLMKRGVPIREAVVQSGLTRLRPIVMTSTTMIMGMLPLALSSGSSSEIKSSMAILIIGGLLSSTLISPILLPVVYTLIDDARGRRKASAGALEARESQQ